MTLADVWDRFADGRAPRRTVNAQGATTWLNWTQYPDHGPNESVLGDVTGRRVLELGSGAGSNLAHLATLGAHCVGVDVAPSREQTARERWGHLPGLEFRTAEATDHLTHSGDRYDVVYSIFGAVWFVAPAVLLPLIRARLDAGGTLAFSHLPPGTQQLASGQAAMRHDHPPEKWADLLRHNGFKDVQTEVIEPPPGRTVGTLLVRAVT
ncbi:class I SAM-dependent methyltransferase [Streptomyces alboflavus]|uniref:class I SAM-dependent methyltransferase n=1 Tax=Streptomyces alboflavus TaxID=67267 RepID=UPI0004C01346|nr:class I SAM-dependent methyltransferase [Streptomyces alboflavus]